MVIPPRHAGTARPHVPPLAVDLRDDRGTYRRPHDGKGHTAMDTTTSEIDPTSRKRSEARQRTELVALRLLPGERETLRTAAQARNISLSELIRSSALKAAET